ncbi:hypothetical protein LLG94_09290 [Pantoea ananatis]|nr:hypothetical protein LLG94_09290 [Pantoea ananatis]
MNSATRQRQRCGHTGKTRPNHDHIGLCR